MRILKNKTNVLHQCNGYCFLNLCRAKLEAGEYFTLICGHVFSIARRTPPSVSIGSQFSGLVFTGFELVYSYPGALIIFFTFHVIVLGCPSTSPTSHFPFCLISTHRYSTLALLLLKKNQDLYSYCFCNSCVVFCDAL
jgi:hypothetical protein